MFGGQVAQPPLKVNWPEEQERMHPQAGSLTYPARQTQVLLEGTMFNGQLKQLPFVSVISSKLQF